MKRAVHEDFKRVPEVKFNTCDEPNYAYEVLVHEAGHILGINPGGGYAGGTGVQSHVTTTESVMNYDHIVGYAEPDCAPYPRDILAITALYQITD